MSYGLFAKPLVMAVVYVDRAEAGWDSAASRATTSSIQRCTRGIACRYDPDRCKSVSIPHLSKVFLQDAIL